MRFHVVSIFPDMMELASRFGIVGQAVKAGLVSIEAVNPRAFTTNVHQTVDDRPFGGGDGMVMLAEPLTQALESIRSKIPGDAKTRVIHLSPRGRPFTDALARELTELSDVVLIASRYGGVDQRFLNQHVDEEISVGDYVLSGGELPALVVIDAVSRLLPGVLGNEVSSNEESFAEGLLEYPQYTRPREWLGEAVPEELLCGDHARIARWRRLVSVLVTADRRPDLLTGHKNSFSYREIEDAKKLLLSYDEAGLRRLGLKADSTVALRALEALLQTLPPDPKKSRSKKKCPASEGEPSGGER